MHINADMTIYIIQSFINKLAVTMRINNHDIYTAGAVMRPSWDAQIRTYAMQKQINLAPMKKREIQSLLMISIDEWAG